MKIPLALIFALAPLFAEVQQTPSVDVMLPRLYAYAREYRAKLPSLSCDESITSQIVKKGRVRKEMKIEATLQEVRDDSKSDPFTERHTFKTVDGHPPEAHFQIPFLIQGGFANGLGFMRPDSEACFDYRLASQDGGATLRLDMVVKPGNADPNCKDVPDGFQKMVLVDASTGRITHVERTISAEAAKRSKEAYFFSIEYAAQNLGGETFWLPLKLLTHDPADEGRMIATYSKLHRFTGELKIVPDDGSPGQSR